MCPGIPNSKEHLSWKSLSVGLKETGIGAGSNASLLLRCHRPFWVWVTLPSIASAEKCR